MKKIVLCVFCCAGVGCFSEVTTDAPQPFNEFGIEQGVRPSYLPTYEAEQLLATEPAGSEDVITLADGITVAASDTATGALYFVDTRAENDVQKVTFGAGVAPSRLATSTDAVYAVLRSSGEVARVNAVERVVSHQAQVCPAPRGVTHDPTRNRVWVACASGELAALDPDTMEVVQTYHVDADLRDVIATPAGVYVSRFRSAEVLRVDPNTGAVAQRVSLPGSGVPGSTPNTAWRMASGPMGLSLLVSYQESSDEEIPLFDPESGMESSYGGSSALSVPFDPGTCTGGIVASISNEVVIDDDGTMRVPAAATCNSQSPLPVDIDSEGCGYSVLRGSEVTFPLDADPFEPVDSQRLSDVDVSDSSCGSQASSNAKLDHRRTPLAATSMPSGQYVFSHRGDDLQLQIVSSSGLTRNIRLAAATRVHLGQRLFHATTSAGISCASCHPDGADDGHIWRFERLAEDNFALDEPGNIEFVRRTQNLRGGIEGKLHWDGEFEGIDELMSDVFSGRMGGFEMHEFDGHAIKDWLNLLRPEKGLTLSPSDQLRADHGKDLYEDPSVGCANCHGGEKLTDYKLYDVGTGGTFKTPTLRGISQRHQLMHDGCAKTLRDRFNPSCGGTLHGDLSDLSEEDLDDLTTYLKTL